jgi:hypothetical protein
MESRKIVTTFLLLLLIASGCRTEKAQLPRSMDFESLMGKELAAWKHVRTEEDMHNLSFFKGVYEKNIASLKEEAQQGCKIPKVIHFIWVGPKPFPRESVENVRSWMASHPDWKVKFWTDRERPLPHPKMELAWIQELPFYKLEPYYRSSDNFGEMSDLLRLEILYNEGGIYVDHDVTCLKSFEPLNRCYDLFCGMEVPYPTCLSSSVLPTNNIVGARAGHIILKKSMDWLAENWEGIERAYPGRDRDSTINRVAHRTFFVLGEMFKHFHNQEGNVDIALPSYYFNAPKIEQALYAQHHYKGTWFENESSFEKMARKRLMMLSKKTNKLLLGLGVLAGLNLIGFALLALFLRKYLKASHG